MKTIKLDTNTPYFSQRNNMYYPHSTCNTTSAIMGLKASGIDFDYPKDMQPEDYLTQLLECEDAYYEMRKRTPWAYNSKTGNPMYPPRQVHAMLAWGINTLVGYPVDRFTTGAKMQEILYNICTGMAVLVQGKFTRAGHIVCVVGFTTKQKDIKEVAEYYDIDLGYVDQVIVDDPYGDYHSGYSDIMGNDIKFQLDEFNNIINDQGNMNRKWAHIFTK